MDAWRQRSPWTKSAVAATLILSHGLVLSQVDVARLSVIETIPEVPQPTAMALSPGGDRLYALSNSYPSAQGSLRVLDTKTHSVLKTIEFDTGFPLGLAASSDGQYIYVSISKANGNIVSSGLNRIVVIDASSNTIVDAVPTGGPPFGVSDLAISPDGSELYVSERGSNNVLVFEAASSRAVKRIPVGPQPIGIAFSPDGASVYVANRGNATLYVINRAAREVTSMVATSLQPSANRTAVAVSSDGKRIYMTASGTDIAVIDADPSSPHQLALIATDGANLKQLSVSGSNPGLLFVASGGTDELLVLDTQSTPIATVVKTIPVGRAPNAMVSQERSVAQAYVGNNLSDSVSVIGPCACGCSKLDETALVVPVDVRPATCRNLLNVSVDGNSTAAILGTSELSVTMIDPSSVRLASLAAQEFVLADGATPFLPLGIGHQPEDCDGAQPDGRLDLILRFDTRSLVTVLEGVFGRSLEDGEVVVLPLEGKLFDGTPIRGQDAVVIRNRTRGLKDRP